MASALGYIRFSIRVGFSDDPRPNARVEFPVVKEIGLERKLSTPVGEVSVSTRDLGNQAGVRRASEWSSVVFESRDELQLSKKYNAFCDLIAAGGEGCIPVKVAAGTTEKSRRVTVVGVYHKADRLDPDREPHKHTVTIPAVHLRQVATQWYAPRWVLVRAIHKRVFAGKVWPDKIMGGQFLDKEKLWELAFTPLMDLLEEQRALLEEQRASLERAKRAEQERLEARREKFLAARESKAATELVPPAPAAKSASQRHPTLDRLEVAWVEWDDWEKVGKGRDKRRIKVTRKDGACTLCFSGNRVYIVLQDREVIKDRKNVRWGLDGAPPAE